jgi:hypothetical protein
MPSLPDPHITLRDARDFVFSSALGRRALQVTVWPQWPLVLHDLLEVVHHLVLSCHMPEFTDHGLPHLCSLVDRLSLWEAPDGSLVVQQLTPQEGGILLLSTLLHDLGMLSQQQMDLPDNPPLWAARDQAADLADWVRRTHVLRLPRLASRVLQDVGHAPFVQDPAFSLALDVAAAHQQWPWEWAGPWQANGRQRGLAALVAVTDLLDEDAARCDTTTLLRHREGNALNRAHWLRHGLTSNRVLVKKGSISVQMHRPPNTGLRLGPVFGGLRNHFRLVSLYNDDLRTVNAEIRNIHFSPCTGLPVAENSVLLNWQQLPGYANEQSLCHHLLRSFMALSLKDPQRVPPADLERIRSAALEDVDLALLQLAAQAHEPGTEIEQAFLAIAGGAP